MDCACLLVKIGYVVTITEEFTHNQSDRQPDIIFEGGTIVPHENAYLQKNCKIRLK